MDLYYRGLTWEDCVKRDVKKAGDREVGRKQTKQYRKLLMYMKFDNTE